MTNYDETRPAEMGAQITPENQKPESVEQNRSAYLCPGEVYGRAGYEPADPAKFLRAMNLEGTRLTLSMLMDICHGASLRAGWWHDKATGSILNQAYHVPIKLCLIHSEISEAMEADRKGLMDDKLAYRPGIEVELADAVIRIFDLAGAMGLDLPGALIDKMEFNTRRADHKVENRNAANGKAY